MPRFHLFVNPIERGLPEGNYLENIGDVIETVLVSEGTRRLEKRIEIPGTIAELLAPVHGRTLAAFDGTMHALTRRAAEMVDDEQAADKESFSVQTAA